MAHEVFEQRELAWPNGWARRRDRHARRGDRGRVGEGQLGGLLRALSAPGQRLRTGEQFWKRERLGQVIVAARLHPLDPVVNGVAGAEEHDGVRAVRRRALWPG